eukprot:708422-Rhodomonas_salina.5
MLHSPTYTPGNNCTVAPRGAFRIPASQSSCGDRKSKPSVQLLHGLRSVPLLPLDGQTLHGSAPKGPERKVPGGQTAQKVLAAAVVNEPGGHALHSPEPASSLYVPRGHSPEQTAAAHTASKSCNTTPCARAVGFEPADSWAAACTSRL